MVRQWSVGEKDVDPSFYAIILLQAHLEWDAMGALKGYQFPVFFGHLPKTICWL